MFLSVCVWVWVRRFEIVSDALLYMLPGFMDEHSVRDTFDLWWWWFTYLFGPKDAMMNGFITTIAEI